MTMNDRPPARLSGTRPGRTPVFGGTRAVAVAIAALVFVAACESAGVAPGSGSSSIPDGPAGTSTLGDGSGGGSPEASPSQPPQDEAAAPSRTVEDGVAFRVTTASSNACQAETPEGWTMRANDRSNAVDIVSPDGTMYAGYGIQAVNTAIGPYAAAYQPPLNDPDLYSADPSTVALAYARTVVTGLGGRPDIAYSGELSETVGEYRLMSLAGSTHAGVVFFRASGYPGDGVNESYILPMYWAISTTARWPSAGLLIARIASSIRCTTQFQPPKDYVTVGAGDGSSSEPDPNGNDAGYNPQLGTEYVTNPATGQNYLVDPSQDWSTSGPDGPGYYVQNGNDWTKLQPGRSG